MTWNTLFLPSSVCRRLNGQCHTVLVSSLFFTNGVIKIVKSLKVPGQKPGRKRELLLVENLSEFDDTWLSEYDFQYPDAVSAEAQFCEEVPSPQSSSFVALAPSLDDYATVSMGQKRKPPSGPTWGEGIAGSCRCEYVVCGGRKRALLSQSCCYDVYHLEIRTSLRAS